ncbi:TetR family transcriptional regulator [Gryllotalpicola daejeonensis]|uniref:TetR family transcriptional regulator n=1 Tax=Gryllotalpicola daejeonensis TaxID=993087 RepID=A0ABP7ZI17_9MICO
MAEFADNGYDATSLRAVARRAGVDAALVHHYFDGKADLLAAAIEFPVRPDRLLDQLIAGPHPELGARIVLAITTQLEDPRRRQRAVALVRAAVANEPVASLAKAFLVREVLSRLAEVTDAADAELRANLVGSQIIGLLITRYVLELEPIASASPQQLAAQLGPTLQRYLFDRLGEAAGAGEGVDAGGIRINNSSRDE